MNLTQFLMRTIVKNLPREKLAEFIYTTARSLPEYQRADFLEKLDFDKKSTAEDDNLSERLRQAADAVRLIEQGGLCLAGDYNEEYDDWYNSLADEFIFRDPENIAGMIENACNLIHQCVDCERYREGYELAVQLITLCCLLVNSAKRTAGCNLPDRWSSTGPLIHAGRHFIRN